MGVVRVEGLTSQRPGHRRRQVKEGGLRQRLILGLGPEGLPARTPFGRVLPRMPPASATEAGQP